MTLDGGFSFASVIEDHLELKRRNSALEGEMPIERYKSDDPFQNHPLFKSEEQARLEETLSGEQPAVLRRTWCSRGPRPRLPRRPTPCSATRKARRPSGVAPATSTGATEHAYSGLREGPGDRPLTFGGRSAVPSRERQPAYERRATVVPDGALAQLGERRLCKPEVTGSIPVRSIGGKARSGVFSRSWGRAGLGRPGRPWKRFGNSGPRVRPRVCHCPHMQPVSGTDG